MVVIHRYLLIMVSPIAFL